MSDRRSLSAQRSHRKRVSQSSLNTEKAELIRKLGKKQYSALVPELRIEMLAVQRELRKAHFPVVILVHGVDGCSFIAEPFAPGPLLSALCPTPFALCPLPVHAGSSMTNLAPFGRLS